MSGEKLAALDLGSNSAHLLVAERVSDRHIRRLATRKIKLRLAEPVARRGQLGNTVRRRALAAVSELVSDARKHGASGIVVVGTDALRAAADAEKLQAALRRDLGLRPRVLDGLEEAALSFRGIVSALRVDGPLLGLDLGGGSLEIAFGQERRFVTGASLPLGSARLSASFEHDPPWPAERVGLRAEALEQLEAVAPGILSAAGGRAPQAAGTAGTIRDLARLGLALMTGTVAQRVRGVEVTREQLEAALTRLVAVPAHKRASLPGLSDSRLDILPAGGIVTLATMEAFGLERLTLCDWGLREGALLDALDGSVLSQGDFTPL